MFQARNRVNDVISNFGASKSILDSDLDNYKKDSHSGMNITSYISNSPRAVKYNKSMKGGRFKSV